MFELQNSPSLRSITNTILSHFPLPLIHSTCLANIHSTVMLTSKWPLWNRFVNINLTANYFNSSDLRVQPILSSLIYYVCLVTWPADNSKISSFRISKLPFFHPNDFLAFGNSSQISPLYNSIVISRHV
jgi:hypothetical protein